MLVHGGWIWPPGRVEIELTLLGHVEKIHDHNIQRKVAVAISLCNGHDLILRRIDRLALDVTVGRPRQQMGDAGELAIAFVDLVALFALDHEERNTISDFRRPDVSLVEAEIYGGFRGIVPDQIRSRGWRS